ncbi:MAG: pantoate kinase [Candidatus Asgardarchaeia archaeon]
MKKAVAFSPAHITGFFAIHDESKNVLERGSRGAGFSLDSGVVSEVTIEEGSGKIVIRINGEKVDAPVTMKLIDLMVPLEKRSLYDLIINHKTSFPIGAGYGISAAGVLSAALAINEIFNLKHTFLEVAQYAHTAEIISKTGLGDVIAECYGRLEIRRKEGAPGIGILDFIPVPENTTIITFSFGEILTPTILTNVRFRERINRIADNLVNDLLLNPSLETFVSNSFKFAKFIGITTPESEKVFQFIEKEKLLGSMVMIGNSYFIFTENDNRDFIFKKIVKIFNPPFIKLGRITNEGAKLMQISK